MGSLLEKQIPWPVGLVVIGLLAGLLFWAAQPRGRSILAVGMVYEKSLEAYAKQHNGHLPASIRDPELQRFLYRPQTSDSKRGEYLELFANFDVAWNAGPSDVDENGLVVSRKRFLIQPAANSRVSADQCESLSRALAQSMKASTTATAQAD